MVEVEDVTDPKEMGQSVLRSIVRGAPCGFPLLISTIDLGSMIPEYGMETMVFKVGDWLDLYCERAGDARVQHAAAIEWAKTYSPGEE